MVPQTKVAMLGLGAMGAYFAHQFMETAGIEFTAVVGEDRYERLLSRGIRVNGKNLMVPPTRPGVATTPADLIIVALKQQDLPLALASIASLVGERTTIISVMNGLDSEAQIGAIYGMERMLYTVSVGIDAVREGGAVTFTHPGKQIFGELDNREISPRVKRVQQLFQRAQIPYATPPDMQQMLWWKFMINVGMNQASAVLRAPHAVFQTSFAAQQLMESLMREVISLARAAGINLGEQALVDWYPVLRALAPHGKTSMLQDVEAGRKTEVEIFGLKVLALAEQYQVSTPVNQAIVQIIKVIEQQCKVVTA